MVELRDIRQTIENRILRGELAPGSRVNENAIAGEMNASRSAVRDAVRILEQSGLVRLEDNKGAFVRAPSLGDALDLYDVRAGLSAAAARLAALNASREDIARLEKLMDDMEASIVPGSSERYPPLNERFHDEIFVIADNQRLRAMHEVTSNELRLFVRRGVQGATHEKISAQEHRRVVDAIKAGDEAAAAAAFSQHILRGKQRMLDGILRAPK
jgi:DNA-binding GntR family transcriptional regulator